MPSLRLQLDSVRQARSIGRSMTMISKFSPLCVVAAYLILSCVGGVGFCGRVHASTAGDERASRLIIAGANVHTRVVIASDASQFERSAATELQKYIRLMTGAQTTLLTGPDEDASVVGLEPVIVIGSEALRRRPSLRDRLAGVIASKPFLRADGIVLERVGSVVYLAGSNDRSHFFAVAELLRLWGVRWFMPGDFGESVPEEPQLEVGALDMAYPLRSKYARSGFLGSATMKGSPNSSYTT